METTQSFQSMGDKGDDRQESSDDRAVRQYQPHIRRVLRACQIDTFVRHLDQGRNIGRKRLVLEGVGSTMLLAIA